MLRQPTRTGRSGILSTSTVVALVLSLALTACASSRPVTAVPEAGVGRGLESPPPTALAMRRGLSLPNGVIETVRPEGFDPTPIDRNDQNLLPGIYVADDQYDDTYMLPSGADPVLDAAMAELERSEASARRSADDRIRVGLTEPAISLNRPSATPTPRPAPLPSRSAPPMQQAATAPQRSDPAAVPTERGGYAVHITSYSQQESIRPGLAFVLSNYGQELEGLRAVINLERIDGKGLFYRLKFGPFGSYEAALARCDRIRARGEYCGVVEYSGEPL